MKKLLFLFLLFASIHRTAAQGIVTTTSAERRDFPQKSRDLTALLGAFPAEVEVLKSKLTRAKLHRVEGLDFYVGRLNGRRVVLVEAGIGKVNAAMTTALMLRRFRPREVVFTGIAGGMNPALQPGDLVVGTRLIHHDYGRQAPAGFQRGPTRNPYSFTENPLFFPADSTLAALAKRLADTLTLEAVGGQRRPRVVAGVIATGDVFLANTALNRQIRAETGAEAVEMEGAAVAQLCFQQKVPFVVIRSLSDSGDDAAVGDIRLFYALAARNSARLVMALAFELQRRR